MTENTASGYVIQLPLSEIPQKCQNLTTYGVKYPHDLNFIEFVKQKSRYELVLSCSLSSMAFFNLFKIFKFLMMS